MAPCGARCRTLREVLEYFAESTIRHSARRSAACWGCMPLFAERNRLICPFPCSFSSPITYIASGCPFSSAIFNFSEHLWENYTLRGLPPRAVCRLLLNTDALELGGGGRPVPQVLQANRQGELQLDLAPFGGLLLRIEAPDEAEEEKAEGPSCRQRRQDLVSAAAEPSKTTD